MTAAPSWAGRFLPHHEHLTLRQKVSYFERSVRKDQTAIAWLESRHAPRTLERVSEIRWYRAALHWHEQLLANAASKLPPPWPPHHQLWLCIHSGEGGWQQPSHAVGADGVPLYWGGMQMHADWGYGTSHHASDDSQLTQEWAAEHAYKASGYSSGFLWQQWAADARCF